jgi:eukaryotic-like serine/threonine-protein kinase
MTPATSPDPERWHRLETLFHQASDMAPTDRAAFLDQACGADIALRRDVESLVSSGERTISDLQAPAIAMAREFSSALVGKRIGPWQILEAIGDGGMGRVYLARRADEAYEQKVAVKIMRTDFGADPTMFLRFRTERQILARLNHANIARLLDGGVSSEGLPYLVMEHVEGVPIDTFCREQGLGVEERLRLFRIVCAAVEYAHRSLVIHRDIKPANILVTPTGVPKLLDFGIARLLDPEFSSAPPTRASQMLLTPEYASPEQIRGESVTTAADVYALGVLLYEILAGSRPFRVKTDNPLEIARIICEQTPSLPSAVTKDLDAKRLRGDLDRVVMMAIRKEPERRYASVEQFSADVEAYLEGFPLQVRTATWGYEASMFVRRHKATVAFAAVSLLLLTGFSIAMGVLARRADRQRQTAEREREFLAAMFQSATPEVARGETITARMLLDRGAQRIDHELAGEPTAHASLLETIAAAYRSLGLVPESQKLAEESLTLDDSIETVELLAELARDKGEYRRAEPLLKRVIDANAARYGASSKEAAAAMAELGECYYWEAKDDDAIALLRNTLAIDRKNGQRQGASTRNYLALALERKGNFDEARQLLQEAVDIDRRSKGPKSPEYATSLHNLGSALIDRGDLYGAENTIREAAEIRRAVLGRKHPDYVTSLNNVGYLLLEEGDWQKAEPVLREALATQTELLGNGNPRLAGPMSNLGKVLDAKGDFSQAEAQFRAILEILSNAHADSTWAAAQIMANIGLLRFDEHQYAQAEKYARQAMELRHKLGGDSTPAFANSLIEVGYDRATQGDAAGGETLLRQALEIRRKKLWPGHPAIITAEVRLGEILIAEGKTREAELLLGQAMSSAIHEPFPLPPWQIAEAKNAYGECLKHLGRGSEGDLLVAQSLPDLRFDPRPAFRNGATEALIAANKKNAPASKPERERFKSTA